MRASLMLATTSHHGIHRSVFTAIGRTTSPDYCDPRRSEVVHLTAVIGYQMVIGRIQFQVKRIYN